VIIKGHEKTHSKRFKEIGDHLRKSLLKTEAVQEEFGKLDEMQKTIAINNFVET